MKVMSKNNPTFNPDEIIKKQAWGLDGSDLGEIKDTNHDYVITEEGIIDKDRFRFPMKSIIHVDGVYVWCRMTEDEAKQYKID
jgi:hypothetical protein